MSDHAHLRRQVLSVEDLRGEPRRRAERHLEECAACRALLARVRATEEEGRAVPIPISERGEVDERSDGGWKRHLDADEREAERRSRRALLERVASSSRPDGVRRDRRQRRRVVPFAVLATAAVLALLLWPRGEQHPVAGFDVAPAERVRGGETGWRSGDAVVVEFSLRRDAYPVLVHVDDHGRPTLLHPASVDQPLERMPARQTRVLPEDARQEAWVLEGAGERGSFLLAIAPRAEVDLAALMQRLRGVTTEAPGRESGLDRQIAVLEEIVGPTQRRDVLIEP